MVRSILLILFLMLTFVVAKSQKFQPGFFIDTRGQKVEGLISEDPSGKAPIKDESFIKYKDGPKGTETRLSASDIKCFVIGADSFVVAHPPNSENWGHKELDFVKVVLNEPTKLYVTTGGGSGSGSGFHFSPGFSLGTGMGGGSFGGAGVSIGGSPYGGSGGGNGKIAYYYGNNTAQMQRLTPENFNDVMSDIMGDEPQALEAIRSGKFTVGNVSGLIRYFQQLKKAHQVPVAH